MVRGSGIKGIATVENISQVKVSAMLRMCSYQLTPKQWLIYAYHRNTGTICGESETLTQPSQGTLSSTTATRRNLCFHCQGHVGWFCHQL